MRIVVITAPIRVSGPLVWIELPTNKRWERRQGAIAGIGGGAASTAALIGSVEGMGLALYSTYLFPLQVTGLLLLIAIIGSILLAKKTID